MEENEIENLDLDKIGELMLEDEQLKDIDPDKMGFGDEEEGLSE